MLNSYHLADLWLTNFLRLMKVVFILLWVGTLSLWATDVHSQNATIHIRDHQNLTIERFIREVESQTNYLFVYSKSEINTNEQVTLPAQEISVKNALDKISTSAKLSYLCDNDYIVLTKKDLLTDLSIQGSVITGVITDELGEPMPGVNVTVKGTTTGVVTDVAGKYSINVPGRNTILVFSFIGYETHEILVGDQNVIDIKFTEETHEIEEVVVVGYGTMKKKDLTGSVTHVNTAQYQDQPKTHVLDMLAGQVAGFNVNQSASAMGGAESFQVRGPTSLGTKTDPLIVLDGVIFNGNMVDINPNDVETVDVLKDASSAAVYGARAAAGVIMITTKKGKKGKPVINFSAQLGVSTLANHKFRPYDAKGFLDFRRDAMSVWFPHGSGYKYYYYNPDNLPADTNITEWRNASANPAADNRDEWGTRLNLFPTEKENFLENKTIDWHGKQIRPGLRQSYDVSIGGGGDRFTYYWSLGYDDNQSLIFGERYTAVRTRLNVDFAVTDWLNVGVNMQYADRDDSAVPISYNATVSPYGSDYDENGKVVWYPTGYQGQGNPFTEYEERQRYSRYNTLFASIFANVKLPWGFKYELLFQPRYEFSRDYNFWDDQSYNGSVGHSKGYGSRLEYWDYEWMVDNILRWNKDFGVHRFDVTLLFNAEKYNTYSTTMTGETFSPSTNLGWHALQQAEKKDIKNTDEQRTGNAYMGRLNYSLMDKYLLTASIRRDGFSAFGQRNPTALFPAAAVAWRISEENFFNIPVVNHLKLRASWGVNGNRSIGNYDALATIGTTPYYDGTNSYSAVNTSALGNASLKWERTEALNFGMDISLLKSRINLTVDYYNMNTYDMLMNEALPILTGFKSIRSNIGQLGNQGFEFTLSTVNIDRENLRWQSNFIFSLNRNKIKKLFGTYGEYTLMGEKRYGELPNYTNKWFPGQAVDVVWDYKVTGVWQVEEAAEAARYNLAPGSFKAKDPDGNGKYEELIDKQFIGHTAPRFRLGWTNDVTFLKHFTASVFFRAELGHIARASICERVGGYSYNRHNEWDFPYWTPENRNNEYCGLRPDTTPFGGGIGIYKSMSFFKIQDFSVGYNLPKELSNKLTLNSMRVSFSIRNLYTATKWIGWDPESGNSPLPRIYSVRLSLSL